MSRARPRLLQPLLFVPLVALGCTGELSGPPSTETFASTSESRTTVAFGWSRHGHVIRLSGEAATALSAIMSDAGAHTPRRRGRRVLSTRRITCYPDLGHCTIAARNAERDDDLYALRIHGPRFYSAASELFGLISSANGVDPRTTTEVRRGDFGCEKNEYEVWCTLARDSGRELTLQFVGLPALGADFVYEGWLVTADGPVSSGRFSPDDLTLDFPVAADLTAEAFVLTIEPSVDPDPGPADTHVLAGPFVEGVAVLTTEDAAALGVRFDDAGGSFILETPSTLAIEADFHQGLWFLDEGGASLDLPVLPAGWTYEGWIVDADGPIAIGRFTDVANLDHDGAGEGAGPDEGHPFPGQDFIEPPRSLYAHAVVVSVEPEPDDSPAPFQLKPLMTPEVPEVAAGVSIPMDNVAADHAITGSAIID